VEFDKIKYFNEIPWRLKISVLLPTALAAVTNVADRLALIQ
jgi:hypothetical protein